MNRKIYLISPDGEDDNWKICDDYINGFEIKYNIKEAISYAINVSRITQCDIQIELRHTIDKNSHCIYYDIPKRSTSVRKVLGY